MAGIYIHIPFCKKACHYCNFHFSTSLQYKNELLDCLVQEIVLQKNYLNHERIDTIYFGGGTPSLLEASELHTIVEIIRKHHDISPNVEFTLEANPDDLTQEKLKQYAAIGINRLSIGIQSFHEEDLQYMNRSHSAEQAIQCVAFAQQAGIQNISVDLIFGFPLLSHSKWEQNIDQVLQMNVPHLSCYAMTVEPQTALAHQIDKKISAPINSEQSAEQYVYLMQSLAKADYKHYEISSFAKENKQSQHNSNYWKGISYLGIGPSAHSFNGDTRQWNKANNAEYIRNIQNNIVPFELEELTTTQKINEKIMISLRTANGLNATEIKNMMTAKQFHLLNSMMDTFTKNEMIFVENDFWKLTNKGKLFADHIASELFVED